MDRKQKTALITIVKIVYLLLTVIAYIFSKVPSKLYSVETATGHSLQIKQQPETPYLSSYLPPLLLPHPFPPPLTLPLPPTKSYHTLQQPHTSPPLTPPPNTPHTCLYSIPPP